MRKRQIEWVSARDWQARLAKLEKLPAKDRREFEEKQRLELDVRDLRDEAVGMIYARYGQGKDGLKLCQAAGGPAPSTVTAWDRNEVYQPHLSTIRRAGLAVLDYPQFLALLNKARKIASTEKSGGTPDPWVDGVGHTLSLLKGPGKMLPKDHPNVL